MIVREPKWLEWARSQIGVSEIAGPADNPKIVRYFHLSGLTGSPFLDDETPWCAAFVGAALASTGLTGTHSAAARSYERWKEGKVLDVPVLGSIVVMHRAPPKPGLGHVGFLIGANAQFVDILGGNQGDQVNVRRFTRSRVICFLWPKNELIKADWMNPPIKGATGTAGSVE
jgi:uncharacterized protein (TIGR02594 family)